MRLDEARRDLYRRLAREQGYKSRAAFKLLEANERYDFLRPGSKVLDLGAAPGGWLQVASELVGPEGIVVGVDLSKVSLRGYKNVVSLVADVFDGGVAKKVLETLPGQADVVLSDLSPQVSGVWELDQTRQLDLVLRTLELSNTLLVPGGGVFCKVFEGEGTPEMRNTFKATFERVRVVKPAASRSASSELYYWCEGFKPGPP